MGERKLITVMETESTLPAIRTTSATRRRIRAISTTIGVVIASIGLEVAIGIVLIANISSVSTYTGYNNNELQPLYSIFSFIQSLLAVAPAAVGGMYWLALRGLTRSRVRVVLWEVTGLCTALFLVTAVITYTVGIEAGRLLSYYIYYHTVIPIYDEFRMIVDQPLIIPAMFLLALFFAALIVTIARFFTKWQDSETPTPSNQGWRDFAMVWSATTFIACACFIGNIIVQENIASSDYSESTVLITEIVLALILPTVIVATIACIDVLRTLRKRSAISNALPSEDPFMSSDNSFTLTYGAITEHD